MSSSGFDAVLFIVYKLSGSGIFAAQDVAQTFHDRLFSQYGVPITIASDREPKSTSHYWKFLTQPDRY